MNLVHIRIKKKHKETKKGIKMNSNLYKKLLKTTISGLIGVVCNIQSLQADNSIISVPGPNEDGKPQIVKSQKLFDKIVTIIYEDNFTGPKAGIKDYNQVFGGLIPAQTVWGNCGPQTQFILEHYYCRLSEFKDEIKEAFNRKEEIIIMRRSTSGTMHNIIISKCDYKK